MTKVIVILSEPLKELLEVYAQANEQSISQVVRSALAAHMDVSLSEDDVQDTPLRTRSPRVKKTEEELLADRRAKKTKREQELERARAEVMARYPDGNYPWLRQEAS